jgi:hypothetical protein
MLAEDAPASVCEPSMQIVIDSALSKTAYTAFRMADGCAERVLGGKAYILFG